MIELGALTRWLTPEVQSIDRMAMAPPFAPYDDVASARRTEASPWVRSLDGRWAFALASGPDDVTAEHLSAPTSGWDQVDVPGSWVRHGHGEPIYLNVEMPFALHAPDVPADNPTGIYRRSFTVPAGWRSRRTVLRIGSADSMVLLWCNGAFVGLGKDSRLSSSFDLTDHLRPGANDLALVVPRWSDASWVEDQDQWWLPGLHRSVELVSLPTTAIADAGLVPGFDLESGTGTLSVDVSVDAPRDRRDLSIEVVVEGPRRKVVGRLERTEVPRFSDRHGAISAYLWPGHRVRGEIRVPDVDPWSHEHPDRYRVLVVLRDGDEVLDVRTAKVGFRSVEVADGALLINGRPVVINGVNRHENHPDTGRVVSADDVRRDLELMKQHHVNAVRTAHYPDGEVFYDLCDELGLYVIDEANVESHGRWAQLADDPAYLAAIVERGVRMVVRDRSHPCIIAWSLGNESGDGPPLDAMAAAIRRLDPSRPVQYEGPFWGDLDAEAPVTDIVCPMYEAPERILAWSRAGRDRRRPLILCEYGHAMGQAGGLDAYWALFGKHRGLQGGFVWEWADHGLRRTEPDGTSWLAYGGDFGEVAHDATFVCDGLVSPDREPHPLLAELAALTAPVTVTADDDDHLTVTNERWFRDLDDLTCEWVAEVDGRVVARGRLDLPTIGPQSSSMLPMPTNDHETGARHPDGHRPKSGRTGDDAASGATAGRCVTFTFRPRRRPTWAPPGWVTATHQVVLGAGQAPGSAPTPGRPADNARSSMAPTQSPVPIGSSIPATFDERGLSVGGRQLDWPTPSLWRAPTDNDDPPGAWRAGDTVAARWRAAGLDRLIPDEATLSRRGRRLTRSTAWASTPRTAGAQGSHHPVTAAGNEVTVEHRQVVMPAGDGLRIDERLVVSGDVNDLPRVGVSFVAPPGLDHLDWFGLGPGDSYPDRRAAARLGRWHTPVVDQTMPFMVPQAYGLHLDTRWFALGPAGPARPRRGEGPGDGWVIWADVPFSFSALPFDSAALSKATHAHQLQPDGRTHVHLDVAHRGLGSGACGPEPEARYQIAPGTFRFRWYLAPVPRGTDPATVVAATQI